MNPGQPAKLLRIHIAESDRYEGKVLYEAIIDKCRELGIAGATVFLGLEGYGETGSMHRAHLIHHDRPVIVTVVDSAANVAALVAAAEKMIDTGLMAVSEVRIIRVQKAGAEDGQ
jgi:PII-like signaling protein